MCLAVPGRIEKILDDSFVIANFMGVSRKVAVDLIEDYTIGDYVIVHAGFAIAKLNEGEAIENIKYLKELMESETLKS